MPDFLKVDDVLNQIDLGEEMSGAEFGCGSALFTIALAKKLKKGKVYALDIQEEKLSALKGKVALEKITNVTTIHADLEKEKGSTLPDNYLDVVLIPNVLFQAEDRYAMIKEANRILKPGGQLVIVDWLKVTAFSPRTGIIGPDKMKEIVAPLQMTLKKEFKIFNSHLKKSNLDKLE